MRNMMVIDDNGDIWPLGALRFRQEPTRSAVGPELSSYAVRNLGYVLVCNRGRAVRVEMRPALVKAPTLIGLYYCMVDINPRQILLSRFGTTGESHELFADVSEFTAAVERHVGDETGTGQRSYASLQRPLDAIAHSRCARVAPVVDLWRSSRGVMPRHLPGLLRQHGFSRRSVLVRNLPGTGRLVFEHCGSGFSFLRNACWPLLAIGRDLEMLPDQEYGCWAAQSYHECLLDRQARFETVSAVIRSDDGEPHWTYYDRVLLPWRAGDGTLYVLGITELRRRALAA